MKKAIFIILIAGLGLSACDFADTDEGATSVHVNFAVSTEGAGSPFAAGKAGGVAEDLVIEGTNGVLAISDVRMIVAEFELKGDDDHCEDEAGDDGECEEDEFEAPPAFISLPLGEGLVRVTSGEIPTGRYTELEFEIEDLDDDEDEPLETSLLQAIRQEFPDWPEKGSVRIAGTFTPNGGVAIPFTMFAEAEIEIEMDLVPPLVVDPDSDDRELTVEINPVLWLKLPDGRVRDLSVFDFETTGRLLELEVEIEDGFTKVEVDD